MLAEAGGTEVDHDAVLTALGVGFGFFFTQPPDEDFPVLAECHDFALPEAAALFGIRLRAMHPPRARYGLADSAEFADHFDDSYVPLIQRALENGQRVLTFRGWSADVSATWGIVDRYERDTHALWGTVPNLPEPVQLNQPALQCYVVEEIQSAKPSALDVLAHGARTSFVLRERGSQVFPGLLKTQAAFDQLVQETKDLQEAFPPLKTITLIKHMEQRSRSLRRFLMKHDSESELENTLPGLEDILKKNILAFGRFLKDADIALLPVTLDDLLRIDKDTKRLLASFVSQ
ncbi:MAG: hypothetical protein DHS20C16_27480 [Phycisphaerae bacterium]|nr:MAG: hypothetical protein DHS20C16_27480 [Phycisphaerae bacterium]